MGILRKKNNDARVARLMRRHLTSPHRTTTRQKRQSRVGWRRRSVIFLWIVYCCGCGAVFLWWQGAQINTIVVDGARRVDGRIVEDAVRATMDGKGRFGVPLAQYVRVRPQNIADTVEKLSGAIRSVHVTKRFPSEVHITIVEWDTVYAWCIHGTEACALFLEDGVIGPRISPVDAVWRDNAVTIIFDQGDALPTEGQIAMEGVTQQTLRDIIDHARTAGLPLRPDAFVVPHRMAHEMRVTTQEGWTILFSVRHPITATVTALRSVVADAVIDPVRRSRLDMVDVRMPRKVFYRVQGEAPTPLPVTPSMQDDSSPRATVQQPDSAVKIEAEKSEKSEI